MIRKRLLSACLALALCLSLLPVTALAAAPIGQVLYVGGVQISSTGYWTTDSDGNVTASTAGETPTDNYIHYDAENNVLTLHNATIKNELEFNASIEGGTFISGSAIGVFNKSGNAELTISLVGTNTIANVGKGIFVLASSASTGSSNLTIQGDGSLNASASQTGIWVQSNGNNAALCVENAEVTASPDGAVKNGVLVQAKDGSDVSLTVNGGSLTASVNANIWFQFGSGVSGSGTPTVTVSNNAIVRANGGIANTSSTSIQYGTGNGENGGIVFDGNEGTVYGSVTLQEDLTIGEGESLTIPEGSSLTVPEDKTITVESGGNLEGTPTGSGTVKISPTITTESLPGGTVGEPYTETILAATGDASITWSVSNGSLPAGLSLSEDGKITGTPTTAGTSTFTVKAENNAGSDSEKYTINIAAKSDTTPPTLTAGTVNRTSDTEATVTFTSDEAGTYFYKVVDSGAEAPTNIVSGTSTDMAIGENTINLTNLTAGAKDIYIVAKDAAGNVSDSTFKIEIPAYVAPSYSISIDPTSLDFGSVNVGYATAPAAKTVTITNTGNQTFTLTQPTATNFDIGTLSATELAAGATATFTVQPKTGLAAGSYNETLAISGSNNTNASITVSFTVEQRSSGGGPTTYAVTAPDAENGTVRVSPSRASRGTTVTITVTPDEGYELESLTVLDSRDNEITLTDKGDGKYTFTMPSGKVTVEASFAEIAPEPLPFGDVDDGDWFADAVRFVYESGMMNGVSETSFAPHATTSRSMIVTILYRLEGEPVVDYAMDFTDVAGDAYYAEAVRWAASEGIVGGYGGGLFGADDAVTREQLAAMLWRYAVYKGYDVSIGEDTNILSYDDFADLSEYAIPAMQWACGAGVITGVTDATLVPQGEATRAQVAAMLMRFCEAIG